MIYLFLLIVNATETSLDHFGSWLQPYSWWGTKRISFISGCNVGALRNSLSSQHVRLENKRDQEWLMIPLPHRECVSVVWTAHRAHQHLQAFVPRLGAHLWMPACPHHSRGPSQARGHQSAGLALVVWIPAFGDFLDLGVSWAHPSFLHLPAITFFSDLGLGLLKRMTVHYSLHTWEQWAVFSAFFLIQDIDCTIQHLSSPAPAPITFWPFSPWLIPQLLMVQYEHADSAMTPRRLDRILDLTWFWLPPSPLTLLCITDACEAMGINEVVESKSE